MKGDLAVLGEGRSNPGHKTQVSSRTIGLAELGDLQELAIAADEHTKLVAFFSPEVIEKLAFQVIDLVDQRVDLASKRLVVVVSLQQAERVVFIATLPGSGVIQDT